jgi:hypothetical protein
MQPNGFVPETKPSGCASGRLGYNASGVTPALQMLAA